MNAYARVKQLFRGGCLVWFSAAAIAAAQPAVLPAAAPKLEASYWREPIFFIPYRFASHQPLADQVDKVRLLVAEQATGAWTALEEGEPHLQGFKYHAARDGEYWFAVQMVDRRGHAWPTGTVAPQLRVIVDSQPPVLKIAAVSDGQGRATLRYEAADDHLRRESLAVEVRANDAWTSLPTPTPDVAQPDRLLGRVTWTPPPGVEQVRWRATVVDMAGNRTTETAQGELPLDAALINPMAEAVREDAGPSLQWPADKPNVLRGPAYAPVASTPADPPPYVNPYTRGVASAEPTRIPAQFAADQALPPTTGTPSSGSTEANSGQGDWTAVDSRQTPADADRLVNSATFEVEYDVHAVGRWGVARVALWGTRDGGQTWRSYAVDDDNRSPIRVTTPGGGVYGFRLVIDGANGAAAPAPQPGDPPELTVQVDLNKPTAELLAAELGPDHLADHLLIRWSAADTNLQPRPIGIFFSTYADGPWSTAATDLENSGQFAWRIERHVPERFFLRLEVRDEAGNVTAVTTPTPIVLSRPQPKGRLMNVRPIATESPPEQHPFSTPPPGSDGRDQTARSPRGFSDGLGR